MGALTHPRFHAALADLTRLRLLNLMRRQEICVCYLHQALGMTQPKISRHLAYLRRSGLVAARKEGRWVAYRLAELAPEFRSLLAHTLKAFERHPTARADLARMAKLDCPPFLKGSAGKPLSASRARRA